MRLPNPALLGAIYGVSEVILGITRRSKTQMPSRDRYSLALLWLAILLGVGAAVVVASVCPAAALPHKRLCYFAGLGLFVAGIVLRWSAIIILGKFFTVDVAITKGHRVVDSGPYHFVRHPSYTGALLAFIGFGLCLGNWLSILYVMAPVTAAFLWRIRVEERALLDALGDDYRAYMRRTKRLLPFLY
jgi:protein-S-isoprenylcysteine O-methyltransferase